MFVKENPDRKKKKFKVENIQQRRELKKKKKMLIKFNEKEYWCKLLNVSSISYKP